MTRDHGEVDASVGESSAKRRRRSEHENAERLMAKYFSWEPSARVATAQAPWRGNGLDADWDPIDAPHTAATGTLDTR